MSIVPAADTSASDLSSRRTAPAPGRASLPAFPHRSTKECLDPGADAGPRPPRAHSCYDPGTG